ncbi:MAG TPA: L,D-transpeptidase family protein [Methylophilaceae bacterium]|nr:L,D-transpeptidase family protein [Methylophilaceae bacterium]
MAFEATQHPNGKLLHSFRIIPDRGSWYEAQFDTNDLLYVYLDRKKRRRKFLTTTLFRALNFLDHEGTKSKDKDADKNRGTDEEILKLFYEIEQLSVKEAEKLYDLQNKVLIKDATDEEKGLVVARAFEPLSKAVVEQIAELGVTKIKVVDTSVDDGIVINLPQRMLFRSVGGKIQSAYPVALGKPDWPTPKGKFVILTREKDKTWLVPPSIQQEMLLEGKEVLERVPPGPDNPLGRYWLGLSLPGIGIHGTLAPQSIYRFASHGCIRLHPDDVEQLYRVVEKDEAGSLIYQPVLLFEAVDGRIFLEVHRDIYKKGVDANRMARELADAAAVTSRVDWGRAASVIAAHEGLARDVTMDANREMP